MIAELEGYQPGRFASTANTPLGRRLWAFITDEVTLHAMEVASDLGQPAVAGIEEALLDEFGEDVLPDRVKQMIGHMVRQAMEREGFIVDQSDVKINSVPFSKGTRYRRPDWYPVHVFRSSANARDLCFTDTRAGEKLPSSPSGDTGHLSRRRCAALLPLASVLATCVPKSGSAAMPADGKRMLRAAT